MSKRKFGPGCSATMDLFAAADAVAMTKAHVAEVMIQQTPVQQASAEVAGTLQQEQTADVMLEGHAPSMRWRPQTAPLPRTQARVFRVPAWDASLLDEAVPSVKAQRNIAALRIAREVNSTGREPTPEERQALQRFTGWGGLAEIFKPHTSAGWAIESMDDLKSLLTDEEIERTKSAILTSYFTPPVLLKHLWSVVTKLGFTGGRVCDPCAGSGNFLASMPQDVAGASAVTAIELDGPTASVLKALYGRLGVDVRESAFERAGLAKGVWDLVVANVPFGRYRLSSPESNLAYDRWSVHDHFLGRSIDLLREGGLLAVYTSTSTMDSQSQHVRAWLESKADLVHAARLPEGAFGSYGGTDAGADLLIFRKKDPSRPCAHSLGPWLKSVHLSRVAHPRMESNSYLHANELYAEPRCDRRIGHFKPVYRGNRGTQLSCEAPIGVLAERLDHLLEISPQGIYSPPVVEQEAAEAVAQERVQALSGREGNLAVVDGRVHVIEQGYYRDCHDEFRLNALPRLLSMIGLRDLLRDLIERQLSQTDEQIEPVRRRLNSAYDAHVRTYGLLGSKANVAVFKRDPDLVLLLSLERFEEDTGKTVKSDIFTRRTVSPVSAPTSAQTLEEALTLSLSWRGGVDSQLIAKLLDASVVEVVGEMLAKRLVYRDPINHKLVAASLYLSGDVKTKLEQAEQAGAEFADNVEALRAVIPEDLKPSEISCSLGSVWVPADVVQAFAVEVLGVKSTEITFIPGTCTWVVDWQGYQAEHNSVCTSEFGTGRRDGMKLLQDALRQNTPTIRDTLHDGSTVVNKNETLAAREKLASLKQKFIEWAYSEDERRERLVGIYNATFNRLVRTQYDGSNLQLPGFSNCVPLHPSQKNAIWRGLNTGNMGLFHPVGSGKSLVMAALAVELRRLGLAKKVCITVPNHCLMQYCGEFMRAYPGARVLMATKEDLGGEARQRFAAKVSTGAWDAVVMTHSTFKLIQLSHKAQEAMIAEILAEIEVSILLAKQGNDRVAQKEVQRQKKTWQARLDDLTKRAGKLESLVTWEELGIDWLMVDEAHAYKNLFRHTNMSRVAGLPTANSQQAFDLFCKARHLRELHGGQDRGLLLATATPVANTLAEVHVAQRYLQPSMLAQLGLATFDAWAGTFGEAVSALELAPDGSGYRINTRFARFRNVPDLMTLFGVAADIPDPSTVTVVKPKLRRGKPQVQTCRPSAALKEFVASLVERAKNLKDPREDNMLKITSDGRKAALDTRLVGISTERDPEGKVAKAARRIHKIWRTTKRLTQIVFCDLSTPTGGHGFSVYEDLRAALVERGMPQAEIEFIHDADTDARKDALFKRVRSGEVRVVMGSTSKLGTGTNIQDLLVAQHDLDVPWRPCDVEQRDGRMARQGNRNKRVGVWRYVTEGSFDAYMWQTLETKARFIAQIMSGDRTMRTVEDISLATLTFAEVKALASGNPLVLEKAGVDATVAKLSALRQVWANGNWERSYRVTSYLPARIKSSAKLVKDLKSDIEAIEAEYSEAAPPANAVINGVAVSTWKEVGEQLAAFVRSMVDSGVAAYEHYLRTGTYLAAEKQVQAGILGSFKIEAIRSVTGKFSGLTIGRDTVTDLGDYRSPERLAQTMHSFFRSLPRQLAEAREQLHVFENTLAQERELVGGAFEHERALQEALIRQAALEAVLDLSVARDEAGTEAIGADEPGEASNDAAASDEQEQQAA